MPNLTINNGGIITNAKNLPNIDLRYGPYESLEAAYNSLSDQITLGLVVGIEVGDGEITEYIANNNNQFVPRSVSISYEDLDDLPKINNVELVGNKTTSDLGISYNDISNTPTFKTINGESVIGGGDITLEPHFKGWFDSLTSLQTKYSSPVIGDYGYVKGATTTDPVKIYECTTTGTWSDSGREFNSANDQSFESGQEVNEVAIKDIDGQSDPTATGVLSAEARGEIKECSKIRRVELVQGSYPTGNIISDMQDSSNYYCCRIALNIGDSLKVCGVGGVDYRLWAIYNTDGTLSRNADSNENTLNAPTTITLADSERYIIINTKAQYFENSYVEILQLNSMILSNTADVQRISEELDEVYKQVNRSELLNEESEGVTVETANYAGVLVDKVFLFYDSNKVSLVGTSANVRCLSVEIPFGISKIELDGLGMVSGGSSATETKYKVLWAITDSNNNILLHGIKFTQVVTNVSATILDVPSSATKLYCSLNPSSTNPFSCNIKVGLDIEVKILQDSVKEINDTIQPLIEVPCINIENIGVKAYRKVQYKAFDYSYSLVENYYRTLGGSAAAPSVDNFLPVGITISAPIDGTATTREVIVADNINYKNSRTMSIDLTSEKVNIYNFEPNKIYWYKVCKDNNTSIVLSSGKFMTEGSTRMLKIASNVTTDNTFPYMRNVRDLGGWKTCDGRMIRYGALIRGAQLDYKSGNTIVDNITAGGIAELHALGVNAHVDLRAAEESTNMSPIVSDNDYALKPLDLWFYRLNIYHTLSAVNSFVDCIKTIIQYLKKGKTIYYGCAGGADRTGALSWVIEGLLGVTENQLNQDYEMTSFWAPRRRNRLYYALDGSGTSNSYDGDFKIAMEYVKGIVEYNNEKYTKVHSYLESKVTINELEYSRIQARVGHEEDSIIVYYYGWLRDATTYYTKEKYPEAGAIVYDSSFDETNLTVESAKHLYWYKCPYFDTESHSHTLVTDNTLENTLNSLREPSLKEKFRLLMRIQYTSNSEILSNADIKDLEDCLLV